MRTLVSPARLHAALDAVRLERGLSWRQLAAEIGVSPSLLSRLGQGLRPDADGFATLVTWLGMPAEAFFDREDAPASIEPELMPQLAALLRADRTLSDTDAEMIETVARQALKRAREQD